MSQKNTQAKEIKKMIQTKHSLEKQLRTPRKKGQPEPKDIKSAQQDLGKIKKSLSKK